MRHILTAEQFDRLTLEQLFARSLEFATTLEGRNRKQIHELRGLFPGHILHNIFMEDSTRTDMSFRTAAIRLGMDVVPVVGYHMSSAHKGEGFRHTMDAFFANDPDVIVLRHPYDGAAALAASYGQVPIINAGDGKNEHPTQGILDCFTIFRQFGQIDDLIVVIGGDLAFGRTTRSLALMLSLFNNIKIRFVAPEGLRIGEDIKAKLRAAGTQFEEYDKLEDAVVGANVVYWSRVQQERLPLEIDYHQVASQFKITPSIMSLMLDDAVLLHPMPIVDQVTNPHLIAEIDPACDEDRRSIYRTKQMRNGVYTRMADIEWVLAV